MRPVKVRRTLFFATLSLITNAGLAIGKIFFGMFLNSYYLSSSALYNVGLCIARVSSLRGYRNENKTSEAEYMNYVSVGIIITVTSVFFCFYSAKWFFAPDQSGGDYLRITAFAIATYTFIKLGLAVYGSLASKNADPSVASIKLTNLADGLVALVLVQFALLSYLKVPNAAFYNGISGILFGTISLGIGIYMILHGRKKMKQLNI